MAYIKESSKGNTESDVLSNKLVSNESLRVKVKQILSENQFYQAEPVEVLEVLKDKEGKDIQYGKILGRFVYSEKALPILRCNTFKPMNSNLMQYPLPGDIVVGFEFFGERFYLPANLVRKQGDDLEPINKLNQEDFDVSNVDGIISEGKTQGDYFKDLEKDKIIANEGDTLIQGRFGNYIKLSSNQISDLTDQLDENTAKSIVNSDFVDTPNIELNVNNASTSGSKILMTTKEDVNYPEQVIEFGNSMAKIQGGGRQFNTQNYQDGQIYLDSERIVFNASKDDIAVFAKNMVHIKGGKGGVQITNAKGGVRIKAKQVVEDFKSGKKLQINKDLTKGDVIIAPDNMKEMGQILAKQVEWNLDFLKVQLGSLIPAAIPGTRAVPNPAWLANIKMKIDNAKKLLEFNDLVFKLKWVDKSKWKTYTMDELKDAFKPIPGFGGILAGFASLKDLAGNIDKVKSEIDEKIKLAEQLKSGELLSVSGQIENFKDGIIKDIDKNLGLDDVKKLKNSLDTLDKTKQKLSSFKGGKETRALCEQYEVAEENYQQSIGTDFEALYEEQRDEAGKKLNRFIINGEANAFENKVVEANTQITQLQSAEVMLDSFVETAKEEDKVELQGIE
tara:strand:- start:1095 stop:2948 length:1854 start_codon:yes stop_codon:yes gene_type:complete